MGAVPSYIPAEAKVGVLIAFASSGRLITPEMVIAMGMQYPPPQLNIGYLAVKGLSVDKAREEIARQAIERKAKYLWFVDDDTVPPPNTLRRLVYVLENNPDVMVVGGVYVTKTDPPTPVVFREPGLGPFWKWKVGEVFEVESMGAGCMLINMEVFKHLEAPYFPWTEDYSSEINGKSNVVSEDVAFCRKVRAAGYRVAAHGGILCDHFDIQTGRTFYLPEDSYPYQPILAEQTEPSAQQDSEKEN